MKTRSLIIIAALAVAFGLASFSGVHAKSKNQSQGGQGATSAATSSGTGQTPKNTGTAYAKKKKKKDSSETSDYLVIQLKDASVTKKGQAKPANKDIVITKPVDKSSPK